MQGGDQADQHTGDDVHARSMAAHGSRVGQAGCGTTFGARGLRRATATPTRASAPPT